MALRTVYAQALLWFQLLIFVPFILQASSYKIDLLREEDYKIPETPSYRFGLFSQSLPETLEFYKRYKHLDPQPNLEISLHSLLFVDEKITSSYQPVGWFCLVTDVECRHRFLTEISLSTPSNAKDCLNEISKWMHKHSSYFAWAVLGRPYPPSQAVELFGKSEELFSSPRPYVASLATCFNLDAFYLKYTQLYCLRDRKDGGKEINEEFFKLRGKLIQFKLILEHLGKTKWEEIPFKKKWRACL